MIEIEEYAATMYNGYKELKTESPELAAELEQNIVTGDWKHSDLYVYDTIEDYACYELTEGWYIDNKLDQSTYNGAPDLLNFIDLKALGMALANSWDDSCHYLTENGQVVTSDWGWERKY